jgi:HPt (histidine-containing phosphotransfer) domain-containing protein
MSIFPLRSWASTLSPDDFQGLREAVLDDPYHTLRWAEHLSVQLGPETGSSAWIRVQVAWALANDEVGVPEDMEKRLAQLEKAVQLAKEQGLMAEALELQAVLLSYQTTDEAIDIRLQKLADEAHEHGLETLRYRLLGRMAFLYFDKGDLTRSMSLQLSINQHLIENSRLAKVDMSLLKNNMALIYAAQNQAARAHKLFLEIDALAAQLRYLRAITKYNLGKHIINLQELDRLPEAERYFTQALDLSRDLKATFTEAIALSGLGELHLQRKQLDKAWDFSQQSLRIFEEIQDKPWWIKVKMTQLEIRLEQKNMPAAAELLKQLENQVDPQNHKENTRLLNLQALTYAALQDYRRAYQFLRDYQKNYQIQSDAKLSQEFQRNTIELGLQLEEEKNQRLRRENEWQAQELQVEQRRRQVLIMLLLLAAVSAISLGWAIMETIKVHKGQMKMHTMLENLDEGLFTINAKGLIEPDYSPYCKAVFETEEDLAGQSAYDWLFRNTRLGEAERAQVLAALQAAWGEDRLTFDMNEASLPRRIVQMGEREKHLLVHWIPVFSRENCLTSMLVSVRDITTQHQLEEQVKEARVQQERLLEQTMEVFRVNGPLLQQLLKSIDDLRPMIRTRAVPDHDILRSLHTLKGNARTMQLKSLTEALHAMESDLRSHAREDRLMILEKTLENYQTCWARYVEQNRGAPTKPSLLEACRHVLDELRERLQTERLTVDAFEIVDGWNHWDPKLWNDVRDILMHACTNALDHGYLFPRARGESIRAFSLHISAKASQRGFELTVADRGQGLNLPKLRQIAKAKGLPTNSDEEVLSHLFRDEFSSSETIQTTSGRGIGLAAIQAIVNTYNGEVVIRPRSGGGSLLRLHLPIQTADKHSAA